MSILLHIWYTISAVLGQLSVTSLPAALFQVNSGVHNIVQSSVIQLYCTANATTATFSWRKDGSAVVIDVPHLLERTTNDGMSTATSVLTVDNFQSSDDGRYQCMAMDSGTTATGSSVILTGTLKLSTFIIDILYRSLKTMV